MCEACEIIRGDLRALIENGGKTTGQRFFEEECTARGLDVAAMPPAAERLVELINALVVTAGSAIADKPGLTKWLSAALVALGRTADVHAEKMFGVIAEMDPED